MVKGQVWEFLIQKQGKGGVIEKTSTSEDGEGVCSLEAWKEGEEGDIEVVPRGRPCLEIRRMHLNYTKL